MMDFSTLYSRRIFLEIVSRLWLLLSILVMTPVWGQGVGEIAFLRVERVDDDVVLSAQMQFDLPPSVEEVAMKGIPITFTAEAEIYRERWYWFDKRITAAQRSYRLAYQTLSRRWRVTVGAPAGDLGAALSLNQSFDSLTEAMGYIKKISRWRVADATVLDAALKYRAEFRYRLDVSQLALPLQIGTLGQSDWNVTLSASVPFALDVGK